MSEFTSYAPGTPSWIDLATTDPDGAKTFYAGIFGWTVVDVPTGAGVYTMFMLKGKPVAAVFGIERGWISPQQEAIQPMR